MDVGIIGAGEVAETIARRLLPSGHPVLLSHSRGPDALAPLVERLGGGAGAGTPQQAAEQDIVILAVRWADAQKALSAVPDWSGRILIDATNRFVATDPPSVGDVSGRTSSEIIQDLAPGSRVVKAFSSVPMAWIDPDTTGSRCTVLFLSGDDAEAKNAVAGLIRDIGLEPVDLGSLAVGGGLQQVGGPLGGLQLTLGDKLDL